MLCLFLEWSAGAPGAASLLGHSPSACGALRILAHTPAQARDPFLDDGAPPALAVQLYFGDLAQVEHFSTVFSTSLRDHGHDGFAHELASVQRFDVPNGKIAAEPWCTYLVRYEGPAQDPRAWHAHYLAHHPGLMTRLPGIRELEIYMPLEGQVTLPGAPARSLQRNKVGFDTPDALNAALNSPERHAMRKDFGEFPPYSGRVTHYPMLTRCIWGTRDPS